MSKLTIALYAILVVSAVTSFILPEKPDNRDDEVVRHGRYINITIPPVGPDWINGVGDIFTWDLFQRNRTNSSGPFTGIINGYESVVSTALDGIGDLKKSGVDMIKIIALKPANKLKWLSMTMDDFRNRRKQSRKNLTDVILKPFWKRP